MIPLFSVPTVRTDAGVLWALQRMTVLIIRTVGPNYSDRVLFSEEVFQDMNGFDGGRSR